MIGPLLMKPARTGGESVDGRRGGPQFPARSEAIPEKIEPLGGLADVTLFRMDVEFERREHGVHPRSAGSPPAIGDGSVQRRRRRP